MIRAAETLYLTTTSLSELLVGIETLPDGKRKEGLATPLSELVVRLFSDRVSSRSLNRPRWRMHH